MSSFDFNNTIKKAGWLIYGLILCAALVFCVKSCNVGHDFVETSFPVRVYPEFTDIDELRKKNQLNNEKLTEMLWNNQKVLNSRYDNMLADIRQESNNTIEKVTAELNFWVAILAFLGVLVPVAITFKGDKDLKDRFDAKTKDQDKRISLFLESAGYQVKSWQDKFQEILKKGKEIDQMKEELDLEMNSICLTSIRNNRLLESQADLWVAQRYLAHDTLKRFLLFFKKAIYDSNNYESTQRKWLLVKYSMQYYDMLRVLSIDYHGSSRPRYFTNGEVAAKRMIEILMEDFPDECIVRNQFSEVLKTTKTILKKMLLPQE